MNTPEEWARYREICKAFDANMQALQRIASVLRPEEPPRAKFFRTLEEADEDKHQGIAHTRQYLHSKQIPR